MPLIKSSSKKAVGENIKKEMEAGKPQKQSIAIALSMQRAAKKKKMYDGGEVLSADETGASSKKMLMGKKPMHEDMHDARKEHMSGIDQEDSMEEEMLEGYAVEHAQERDFAKERRSDIDSERTDRDEDMLGSKPRRHKDEILATEYRKPVADDKDEYGEDMLHQHEEEDSYSKDGIVRFAKGGIAEEIMKRKRMASGGEVDLDENMHEEPNHEDDLSYDLLHKKVMMGEDIMDSEDQPMDSNEHSDELEDADSHDMVDMIRKKMRMKR